MRKGLKNKWFQRRELGFLCGLIFMFIFINISLVSCDKTNTRVISKETNLTSIDKKDNIKEEKLNSIKEVSNLGELKISFINVGQADSILLEQGNNSMLIDGGNREDGNLVKEYISKQGVKNIDVVIGTHPHEDHIGGLSYVMNAFKVGKIYLPEKTSTTNTYKKLIATIKSKNVNTVKAKVGEEFNIGKAKCTILAPRKQYEKVNDNSIVLKVKFGEKTFLFTGDAEATSEMDMVKAGSLNSIDLLKVGHHGSKTSSCINFLKTIMPKYAVISVGKDNKYSLPNKSTLDKLKQINADVYRTDKSGTIVATSDGKNINFNTKPIAHDESIKENKKTNIK